MLSVRKLEVSLLKMYVVNAQQMNRPDKVTEFFEKMTPELHSQPEFREWFTFPFLSSPQENATFAMYFSKQWQDTLTLSLHNFLSVILQAMPVPTLLNFEHDYRRMKLLLEENESLKKQIVTLAQKEDDEQVSCIERRSPEFNHCQSSELVYDFSGLSDENTVLEKQQKRLFPLSLSSPLTGKKKPDTTRLKLDSKAPKVKPSVVRQVVAPVNKPPPPKSKHASAPAGNTQAACAQVGSIQYSSSPHLPSVAIASQDTRPKHRMSAVEFEKQRRELLGDIKRSSDNKESEPVAKEMSTNPLPVLRSVSAGHSVTMTTFDKLKSEPSSPAHSAATETHKVKSDTREPVSIIPPAPVTGSVTQIPDGDCPFLLLSQEEYGEHHSAISYCKFSMSGQYISSLDVDGIVKVWTWSPQPATMATVMSKSAFLSLDWASKSDRWLLLGNRTGNIRLFDVKEIKTFREVVADQSYPRIINITANPVGMSFVCSATVQRIRSSSGASERSSLVKPGKLMLWDLRSMKLDKVLPLEPSPIAVNCCVYNHNGQLLITGAADGKIRLFDIQQHKCINQWDAHEGEVHTVQFSSDETTCYSMGSDGKFAQWNMNKTGKKVRDIAMHQGAVLPFLATSPTGNKEIPRGKLFAFDSEGQYVLTCDKNTGVIYQLKETDPGVAKTMELKGPKNCVTTVDWSPTMDTRVCLMGAMDGKIRVSTLLSQ
ncbi:WD repeat-containing protein 91-like isoform X2 [Gigantopelta aegis]|nr:WD repeat-containing protein 91-like isoform X2 [Gigantopelta aegis]